VKKVEQLPAQQNDGQEHNHNGHHLAEAQTGAIRLKTPGNKTQDVERCKAKNKCPQDVIKICFVARELDQHNPYAENKRAGYHRGGLRKTAGDTCF